MPPEQGEDLIVTVSATAIGTQTPVNGMNRYSARKSRPVNRTSVFMRATPYVSRGQKDYGFTLSGLLIMADAGQQLIRDAEAAGTSVFLTVLPNGIDGFQQEVLPSTLSHDANPDAMQDYGFEFVGVDEAVEVEDGPIV